MEKVAYVGLDPGKSGFITVIKDKDFLFYEMPSHKVETGKLLKSGKPQTKLEFHEEGFKDLVFKINQDTKGYKLKVGIEKVIGRSGWSAENNFNFGYVAGMQKMIFIMLGAELIMVRPQKWQSFMRQGYESIKKASSTGKTMVNDPKAVAELIVDTEYPNIDFRKTIKSKNKDDNKVDSFLIALYIKRVDNQQNK
ncbi:hypothetical protein Phi19:2_gp059 [Cellulophaga phage phi19:2]|uniref:Uncharacterized protein n=3 Tax=Cellulophaga phage phiST TaxID=756282 RepID=M4T1S3_9CAUD|nr:Holliday junction resolvase [Cellulophaga phage phiST]AGH56749.1 hypothetical protein CGPG_00050 [Cellulophaga phage phiST]AGO47198.1 hypothetical protein PhiST_gp059 [Cellulophaga phage phiST]AGO48694.1 hypothetical protein Phi19:2_gp059 [Cellulophaga phage phi19:2]AGO49064.1 hypothetical protein Phi13:1_gp053 [Cellulophaga phage phi13:1]